MMLPHLFGLALAFSAGAVPSAPSPLRALVPAGQAAVAPRSACIVEGTLVAVSADGRLVARHLAEGKLSELPTPEPVVAVTRASGASVWALAEAGGLLYRLSAEGKVLARVRLPLLASTVTNWDGQLVLAQMVMGGGETLLWRGDGSRFTPWALEPRAVDVPFPLGALANIVALSGRGPSLALVFPAGRPELLLLDGNGKHRTVSLPYFGAPWAPVTEALGADFATWPKPYVSVAATHEAVWCLSFQEGPFVDDPAARVRGRHLVAVGWDGEVRAVHTLPIDGYQLASDDGERVLILDRFLGVWELGGGAR